MTPTCFLRLQLVLLHVFLMARSCTCVPCAREPEPDLVDFCPSYSSICERDDLTGDHFKHLCPTTCGFCTLHRADVSARQVGSSVQLLSITFTAAPVSVDESVVPLKCGRAHACLDDVKHFRTSFNVNPLVCGCILEMC